MNKRRNSCKCKHCGFGGVISKLMKSNLIEDRFNLFFFFFKNFNSLFGYSKKYYFKRIEKERLSIFFFFYFII